MRTALRWLAFALLAAGLTYCTWGIPRSFLP